MKAHKQVLVIAISALTLIIASPVLANPNNKHYDRGYSSPGYQQRVEYYEPAPVQYEHGRRHGHGHGHGHNKHRYQEAPRAVYYVPSHQVWRGGIWITLPQVYSDSYVPPMPAVGGERIPRYAHPDFVWVRGFWSWGGVAWVWNRGHWAGL